MMQIDLHVWLHNVPDLGITGAISKLSQQMEQIMADLTALTAAVAKNTDAENSAIALIQGLAAQVAALAPTQAAIDALAADISAKADALAAAVVANTPAA
jgi:hypothetical protein